MPVCFITVATVIKPVAKNYNYLANYFKYNIYNIKYSNIFNIMLLEEKGDRLRYLLLLLLMA